MLNNWDFYTNVASKKADTNADPKVPEQANAGDFQPTNTQENDPQWDYKTAVADMKGNIPMTYKLGDWELKPEGFDPNGNAYFGSGITGWTKKLAYKALTAQWDDSSKYEENQATVQQGFDKLKEVNWGEAAKEFLKDVTPIVGITEDIANVKENGLTAENVFGPDRTKAMSGAWDVIKGIWGVGSSEKSPISGVVKLVNIGAEAAIDVFQMFADTAESVIGLNKTMRTYVDENGSKLPDLMEADFDPKKIKDKYMFTDELVNTFARSIIAPLNVYDNYRFWTAPGTFKEKTAALSQGWEENKMLYSELVRPSIEEEFKRRVKAGEDPTLLAMELQDPFAELAGELIFDPLNVTAPIAKANKFSDIVKTGSNLGGVSDDVVDLLKTAGNVSTPAQASKAIEDLDGVVKNFFYTEDGLPKVFGKQDYKITAYTATSNQLRLEKQMTGFTTWGLGNIKNKGGSIDDALDWLGSLTKLSSDSADERKAAISYFASSKMVDAPLAHLSQQALETSHYIRSVIGKGEDVENFIAKLKTSSWEDQAVAIKELSKKVAKSAYPTVSEMADAAKAVGGKLDELADTSKRIQDIEAQLKTALTQKAPQGVKRLEKELASLKKQQSLIGSDKQLRLATEYAKLQKTNPAVIKLAEFDRTITNSFRGVNTFLNGIYFTSYGFAVKNAITNQFSIFADAGIKAYTRSGELLTMGKIDADLAKWFPAGLPESIASKPYADSFDEGAGLIKSALDKFKSWKGSPQSLAAAAEVGAGKRVFYKFYRDTMENALEVGRGLPKMEEWVARGFSPEFVDDYVSTIKATGYNTEAAREIIAKKYSGGVDVWRTTDWVKEDVWKGLNEHGARDAIVNFLNDGETKTQEQIRSFFNDLVDDATQRAGGITNDPIGQPRGDVNLETEKMFKHDLEEYSDGVKSLEDHKVNVRKIARQEWSNALKQTKAKLYEVLQQSAVTKGAEANVQAVQDTLKKIDQFLDAGYTPKLDEEAYKQVQELHNGFFESVRNGELGKFGSPARDAAWKEIERQKDAIWNTHFQMEEGVANGIADDIVGMFGEEFSKFFHKAKNATVDVQNANMVIAGKDGGLFHVPPKNLKYTEVGAAGHESNLNVLANAYGIPSASKDGAPTKQLLNIVNKYSADKYASMKDVPLEIANEAFARSTGNAPVNFAGKIDKPQVVVNGSIGEIMNNTTTVPRSELPPVVSDRIASVAKQFQGELYGGEAKGFVQATDTRYGSTNVGWYKEINKETNLGKAKIEAAIERIIKDKGSDKGKAVEIVKEKIMDILVSGGNGQPPDLYVLQELGAPEKIMQEALDTYNEMTKGNATLEEALSTMGAPAQAGYYDDAGNFVAGEAPAPLTAEEFTAGSVVENTDGLLPAAPKYIDGATPTMARVAEENKAGLIEALKYVEDGILSRFGRRSDEAIDAEKLATLSEFEKTISDNINTSKLVAQNVGAAYRDFALHAYGENTQLDHALSLVYPYQFWYSRTYASWGKRLATNANTIAAYGKLKDYMANEYKNLPDWWKYNVQIPDFLGINNGNPYFFNLESAIWPLQGITGTDFNDPEKRTNWFTATVDDMGKFGPSTWTPISIGIAAYYQLKGEKDIAAKWGTRLIPQTATLKAASSYFGNPIELDPNVQIFSGNGLGDLSAADPYEEGRISRALAAMEAEGIPKEQLIEAARTHTGPLWEQAYINATQDRAPSQIMSSFLGVAFKGRKESDLMIDNFYGDYARMRTMHDGGLMSDEQYKAGFDKLRIAYPFMDVILLSRRAGMGREEAYAYNVISRIPPGQTKEIYNIVGIDPETAKKFYDSGGKTEGMSETEKARFMAGMIDAGAMLALPSDTTRAEWVNAKDQYKGMQESLKLKYGDDILEKISLYYGEDDKKQAKLFLETNQDVSQALDEQTALIANNPTLMQYYGGLNTIEAYYNAQMYDKLEKQFGVEVLDAAREYSSSATSKERKAELKDQFNLDEYWDTKSKIKDENLRIVVEFGSKLPDSPLPNLRTDTLPENPTQAELAQYAQPQPQVTFDQWSGIIGPEMTDHILGYWNENKNLTSYDKKELDYQAAQYGYQSGDDMLKAILMSLQ